MVNRSQAAPAKAKQIELRTWFIEPVVTPGRKLFPELIRVWGTEKTFRRTGKWWRSSSIHQRLSSSTLMTRYGTIVKIKGGISKSHAKKLHMNPEAIERFADGFPATWRRILPDAFTPDLLKESHEPLKLRRSPRGVRWKDEDATPARQSARTDKHAKEENVEGAQERAPPRPILRSRRTTIASDGAGPRTSPVEVEEKIESRRRSTGTPVRPAPRSVVKQSKPSTTLRRSTRGYAKAEISKTLTKETRHTPRASRKTRQNTVDKGSAPGKQPEGNKSLASKLKDAQETKRERRSRRVAFADVPTSADPGRRTRHQTTNKSAQKEQGSSEEGQSSLTSRLRKAQETKRAQRSRRVAFADAPGRLDTPTHAPPKPLHLDEVTPVNRGWSDVQLKAFEQQRRSVPADHAQYWDAVAEGVDDKTAAECRALWESSWTSPRTRQAPKNQTRGGEMETGAMVAALRKASRKAQSRNTGKFRRQTRQLADRVAERTGDAVLEPTVPGAAAAADVLVTPRAQMTSTLADGTPGTEVRSRRQKIQQAGALETPEIISRGKAFGMEEADLYVALFKRRLGQAKNSNDEGGDSAKGEAAGSASTSKNKQRREHQEMQVGKTRGDDQGSEYSDDSKGSSPFF